MKVACQFIKIKYVFIVSFLTILNSGAVYQTFTLYRQLYFVNKGGKLLTSGFFNQINVFNVEMFCFAMKILRKCSLKAANSKF